MSGGSVSGGIVSGGLSSPPEPGWSWSPSVPRGRVKVSPVFTSVITKMSMSMSTKVTWMLSGSKSSHGSPPYRGESTSIGSVSGLPQ